MTIHYTLCPSNPSAHIFSVSVYIEEPNPEGQIVSLPAWIPGSYMIREFSKNIVEMHAFVGEEEIPLFRIDKHTWMFQSQGQPCTIRYTVYAWDLSVRMAHLDQTHGYCNGTSVFLEVQGQSEQEHRVLVQAPTDPMCQNWKIATTLTACSADPYTFGWFKAENYDELIDHPIEMGTFELLHFEACGVPHEVALTGVYKMDAQRLIQDLQKICETEIQFFGEPAPMERYLFQVMVVGSGYGGLEHRASTSLICNRDSLPANDTDTSEEYQSFLGLCSHEYFHTWNVKRIKPAVFLPYDLTVENYTSLLWVFEGWTSYYDDLILRRAGLLSTEKYLEILGKTITSVYKGSGLHKQSLAESSFTAWTKYYRQDENSPNAIVSYYTKGSLAALALDLHVRMHSTISLDTVMKELWIRFGSVGVGVPENGVEELVMELSGLDLRAWFDAVVRGTGELPFSETFAHFGLELCKRYPASSTDKGGGPKKTTPSPSLGVIYGSASFGVSIKSVHDNSPAQLVGLSAGDTIIAINGIQVTSGGIEKMLARYGVGEEIQIHAFRRDELFVRNVVLVSEEEVAYYIVATDDNPEAVARRTAWLEGR